MEVKKHPILGIPVREDGAIYVRHGRRHQLGWTFGSKNGSGYMLICIEGKRYSAHRLVAETFIQNTDDKPFIDHINRDRADNRVENLRWVTNGENQRNSCAWYRIESRDGIHHCDNPRGWAQKYRERKQAVRFSNGKMRWVDPIVATKLLLIPLKERVLFETA